MLLRRGPTLDGRAAAPAYGRSLRGIDFDAGASVLTTDTAVVIGSGASHPGDGSRRREPGTIPL